MHVRVLRYAAGAILLAISFCALAYFRDLSGLFRFASPDGDIHPASFLELRIILIAMGPVGLYLLLWTRCDRLLFGINRYVAGMTSGDCLRPVSYTHLRAHET